MGDDRASSSLSVTLLGSGPLLERCRAAASGEPRVRFEPWIDYDALAPRIHRAHVLLGAFGTTPKADRVIPTKVYQALACARPVLTRAAQAYPPPLLREPGAGLRLLPAGRPEALAQALDALCAQPSALPCAARAARESYERWFSSRAVRAALRSLLVSLDLPAAAPESTVEAPE